MVLVSTIVSYAPSSMVDLRPDSFLSNLILTKASPVKLAYCFYTLAMDFVYPRGCLGAFTDPPPWSPHPPNQVVADHHHSNRPAIIDPAHNPVPDDLVPNRSAAVDTSLGEPGFEITAQSWWVRLPSPCVSTSLYILGIGKEQLGGVVFPILLALYANGTDPSWVLGWPNGRRDIKPLKSLPGRSSCFLQLDKLLIAT